MSVTTEQTQNGLVPAAAPAPMEPQQQNKLRVQLGIAPQSLDEGWRLAQYMATSSLVPKAFQGKPADVLVAIELGMEVGFAPMQALQSIAVINGRPSIWGDGFLALIMASPHYQDHDEFYEVGGQRRDGITASDMTQDTTTAVCTFIRKGKATPVTQRFSVAHAKKAGLIGKVGPWQEYPDRMLKLRARGFAGRDAFPDVLRGIRTTEEALDQPPEMAHVTPIIQQPRRLEIVPTGPTGASGIGGHTLVVDQADPPAPQPQRASTPQQRPAYQTGAVYQIAEVIQPPGKDYWYFELNDHALVHCWDKTIAADADAAQKLGASVRLTGEAVENFQVAPFRVTAIDVVEAQA